MPTPIPNIVSSNIASNDLSTKLIYPNDYRDSEIEDEVSSHWSNCINWTCVIFTIFSTVIGTVIIMMIFRY